MVSSTLLLLFGMVVATTATMNTIAVSSTESTFSYNNNKDEKSVINTTLSALLAFKHAISHDPTGFLALWADTSAASPDYCNWNGIRCSRDGTHNVIALLLESNQLTGMLPPQLKELSHLSYLNVSNNSFHGPIPPQLGELSSLTHLDLSVNQLTGDIPLSLANCTLLQHIDLRTNSLSGKFPPFLTNFTHLVYLDMSVNTFRGGELPSDIGRLSNLQFLQLYSSSLTGSLPASITNCTKLVWLFLDDNELTGPLPSDWSKLASISIQKIYLYDNSFTGSIPSSLGNCTTLIDLELGNNSLTGELPESLGKLAKLQYLFITFTDIQGPIPTSIMNCTRLMILELGYNQLTGSIPEEIGQLKQVLKLSFYGNAKLSGIIPESIGECAELQTLSFRFTEIGGPLPMSIYNLSSLQNLWLSSSRFSGSLSEDIKNLTELTSLWLAGNAFTGKIPAGLGKLTQLQGLDLQHNRFEGPIPQEWRSISISQMDFSYNLLTGYIPAPLGQLQHLNNLYLQHNRLSGDIPAVFGSFPRLQNLDLSHNMLTGHIPPSLSVTESLDLSFNNLAGALPPSMGSMQMVTTIRLAGNHLTGEIPDTFAQCYGLEVLDLSVNNLEGEIPSTLGQLPVLEYMNLSQNKLSGALPPSLGALQDLVSLNVSYNALHGMIPSVGIFKNSSAVDFRGNPDLCGYPLSTSCTSDLHSGHSGSRRRVIVSVCSIGGGILVLLIMCAGLWQWRWWSSSTEQIVVSNELDGERVGMQKPQLRAWTAQELRAATNGFDTANVIGSGGVSVCFKGSVMPEGQVEASDKLVVAIKRFNTEFKNRGESWRSFVQELKTLCQVRHRNLVKTLGYCMDEGEVALVMEFMENGNLDGHLHGESKRLCWDERLQVAVGVANALVYLHHEYIQPIIHCDIKPQNILLGSDMVAKISDFGIAKLLDCNQTTGDLSISNFRGTLGYAAPECAAGSGLSTKADLYSYGVLLIELVTGMKPTNPQLQECGMTLHTWARGLLQSGHIQGFLDTAVQEALKKDPALLQQLEEVLDLGAKCTNTSAKERPNIKNVQETLIQFTKPKRSSLYIHLDIDSLIYN